jgi:hypothetical protein
MFLYVTTVMCLTTFQEKKDIKNIFFLSFKLHILLFAIHRELQCLIVCVTYRQKEKKKKLLFGVICLLRIQLKFDTFLFLNLIYIHYRRVNVGFLIFHA